MIDIPKLCLPLVPGSTEQLAKKLGLEAGEIMEALRASDLFIMPQDPFGIWRLSDRGETERAEWAEKMQQSHVPSAGDHFQPVSDSELSGMSFPPSRYIVSPMIPSSGISIISAKRSSGKTWLALYLAASVSAGKQFLGIDAEESVNVLFLDGESGLSNLQDRMAAIRSGMGIKIPISGLYFMSFPRAALDDEEFQVPLLRFLREKSISLVVFDSLRRFMRGEENSADAVSEFFSLCVSPLISAGVAVVFLHHDRKGQPGGRVSDRLDEIRGSSDLANIADSIINLRRLGGPGGDTILLTHGKNRRGPEAKPLSIKLTWEEGSIRFVASEGPEEAADKTALCAKKIVAWAQEEGKKLFQTGDVKAAMKGLGFSSSTCERSLANLLVSGFLFQPQRGKYLIVPSNPQLHQDGSDGSDGKPKTKKPQKKENDNKGTQRSFHQFHQAIYNDVIDGKDFSHGGISKKLREKHKFPDSTPDDVIVSEAKERGEIHEPTPGRFRFT